jgi:hypothetical protein
MMLLPLLALLAAPLPAAAQSDGLLVCFENDTAFVLFRVRAHHTPAGGAKNAAAGWERFAPKQQHCQRVPMSRSLRLEVEHWNGSWLPTASGCSVTISNPTGGVMVHARRTAMGQFVCGLA